VRLLEADQDDTAYVLFEADRSGLEFLSRLFASQARFSDPGFFFGPRSAGKAVFGEKASLGVYIQRVEHMPKKRRG